jgi:hypothetical protein
MDARFCFQIAALAKSAGTLIHGVSPDFKTLSS